jgi:stage V sporulation protein B
MEQDVSVWWGIFSGKYRVLTNVPFSIASALAVSAVPALTAAFARRETRQVRKRIGLSLRFEMVVAFPCAVGLFVLASPIQQLLFRDSSDMAGMLLMLGSISVVFFAISTFSNAVLQAIDRMRIPVINALVALGVQTIVIIVCMLAFHMGIYSVVVANIVFSLLMCILNGRAVNRYSGFVPEIRKTYILPGIAAVIMGVVTKLIYLLLFRITGFNSIATIIAILAAILTYGVALLLTHALTEEEILSFPKGNLIVKVAKKVHLL